MLSADYIEDIDRERLEEAEKDLERYYAQFQKLKTDREKTVYRGIIKNCLIEINKLSSKINYKDETSYKHGRK